MTPGEMKARLTAKEYAAYAELARIFPFGEAGRDLRLADLTAIACMTAAIP